MSSAAPSPPSPFLAVLSLFEPPRRLIHTRDATGAAVAVADLGRHPPPQIVLFWDDGSWRDEIPGGMTYGIYLSAASSLRPDRLLSVIDLDAGDAVSFWPSWTPAEAAAIASPDAPGKLMLRLCPVPLRSNGQVAAPAFPASILKGSPRTPLDARKRRAGGLTSPPNSDEDRVTKTAAKRVKFADEVGGAIDDGGEGGRHAPSWPPTPTSAARTADEADDCDTQIVASQEMLFDAPPSPPPLPPSQLRLEQAVLTQASVQEDEETLTPPLPQSPVQLQANWEEQVNALSQKGSLLMPSQSIQEPRMSLLMSSESLQEQNMSLSMPSQSLQEPRLSPEMPLSSPSEPLLPSHLPSQSLLSSYSHLSNDSNEAHSSPLFDSSPPSLAAPPGRWGHSGILSGDSLYIFGGQGSGSRLLSSDHVWQLDCRSTAASLSAMRWCEVKVTGTPPSARMGHAAVAVGHRMYVIGGSNNKRWFGDVHLFNLDTGHWHAVNCVGAGPGVAYHSATAVGDDIYVFGGAKGARCSNTVYSLNTARHAWTLHKTRGKAPTPRSGHSATLVGDRIFIFGGWDAPRLFNDLFVFDPLLLEFTAVKTTGDAPSPRCWHVALLVSPSQLFVYGGFNGDAVLNDAYVLDLRRMHWTRQADALLSSGRAGMVAAVFDDRALIHGGGDNEGDFFASVKVIDGISSAFA